jgi:chloramphenicol 3-O-phosphotransferase
MKVIILTGPPRAGKNTIGELLAKRMKAGVFIDVDKVRWMIIKGHKAPWEGEEGSKQQELGVKNTCQLSVNFLGSGYDVVIADVLNTKTVGIYRSQLSRFNLKIVLLLPSFEELERRSKYRPAFLRESEIKMIYEQQSKFSDYDLVIDNSKLSAEEVTKKMDELFDK